ncbi:hypothetical protein V5O48_006551, partial [Marasmius crinis-equi]
DLVDLILIIQHRGCQGTPLQRMVLWECSLPDSALRALRSLVAEVNDDLTTTYGDKIFIAPSAHGYQATPNT